MTMVFALIALLIASPVRAGAQRSESLVQTSPTDCEVFAAVLRDFYAQAKEAGRMSGYVTLKYVVSDRTHALPAAFEQMATNEYFGPAKEIRKLLRQPIYESLVERAKGRAAVTCSSLPSAFRTVPDRFLPTEILIENTAFERRFAPAEGVIYLTMPGYSDDYRQALVVSEMYFWIWETATLYVVRRDRDRWNVISKRMLHEQGE